ncbi:hypothetical protein PV10_00652 [Exophiala mesophila]|uniref:CHRD domain-containing protein n=1 Tax=Exophiala mesophila TaxID=212818 RepID=A0A0D1X4W0_EXOME|nr:uncharacterized protein PV10_00652 [Exophiala mesophila]KIV96835.1 hypothetical protein PV10_00652 [Exophiala mesophila]
MKTTTILAAAACTFAGFAAATPVAEPQGRPSWWFKRPGFSKPTPAPVPAPDNGGSTPDDNTPAPVSPPKDDCPTTGGGGGSSGGAKDNFPFVFTSTYSVIATPDQVINGTQVTPGEPGARGIYNYGINTILDVICYNITLTGVTGDYQSAALTATHIHEGPKGAAGPPRLAFPNPTPISNDRNVVRRSVGCLTGPFRTGINNDAGVDTGSASGFTLSQIEANPAGFFTDSHTANYVPGVVRGQLA